MSRNEDDWPHSEDEWAAELKEGAETGEPVMLAPLDDCDPSLAHKWASRRTLPAAALRRVLAEPKLKADPRGLRIVGARFVEALDLARVQFPYRLALYYCSLEGQTRLDDAEFFELDFQGSYTSGISMAGAKIDGDVLLGNGFKSVGGLSARRAKINGRLSFQSSAELINEAGHAIALDDATVTGSVVGDDEFIVVGGVRAIGAKIGGLTLTGSKLLTGGGGRGRTFSVSDGQAVIGEPVRVHGDIDALSLDGAEIESGIFGDRLYAEGQVRALGAKIGSAGISLRGAVLFNEGGYALSFDRAEIDGDIVADGGFCAIGQIHALSAKIAGQFVLDGATVRNSTGGKAVWLDGAQINEGMYMQMAAIWGQIRAVEAKISRLLLHGADLHNPDDIALSLEAANVGHLYLQPATVEGSIHLQRSTIGVLETQPDLDAPVEATGWKIRDLQGPIRDDWEAVKKWLDIKPPTLTTDKWEQTTSAGDAGQSLERVADLDGRRGWPALAQFWQAVKDDTGAEVFLARMAVANPVRATGFEINEIRTQLGDAWQQAAKRWLSIPPPEPSSRNTALTSSTTKKHRWPNTRCRIWSPPGRRCPTKEHKSVQPWHAIADVYDRNGNSSGARKLRYTAAKRLTSQSPPLAWAAGYIYRLIVGHGYYPGRAAVLLAIVILAAWIGVATMREDITPVTTRAQSATTAVETYFRQTPQEAQRWLPVTAETPCQVHPDYPCLNSFTFALTNLLPTAGTSPSNADWTVNSDARLTTVLLALKFLTWALAALVAAGITGLLKKTA